MLPIIPTTKPKRIKNGMFMIFLNMFAIYVYILSMPSIFGLFRILILWGFGPWVESEIWDALWGDMCGI